MMMSSISLFQDSVFFGVLISLASYGIGMLLKMKTGWSLMNPLLIAIVLVICVLLLTGVDYKTYSAGANMISYLLTPATICGGRHRVGCPCQFVLRIAACPAFPFRPCLLRHLPA